MSDLSDTVAAQAAQEQEERARGSVSAWDRLSFACMRGVLSAHTAVWGIRGLYRTSRAFGALEYLVNYKRRRRVRDMLEQVYGRRLTGSERRQMVSRHFMRQRADKVYYLVFDRLPSEKTDSRFSITNQHLLDEALARGKGVYVLLSHHGAHHVIGMHMPGLGYRIAAIRDPNEGAIRRYVQEMWERRQPDAPRPVVLYSGDFIRPIYRLLRDNYALGSALDMTRIRDDRLKTAPVQIFGETRPFLTGTLQIAIRCHAAVLQAFVISEPNFHYRLEFLGPMTDPETCQETPEQLQAILQQYADNIAEYARRYPDHVTRV